MVDAAVPFIEAFQGNDDDESISLDVSYTSTKLISTHTLYSKTNRYIQQESKKPFLAYKNVI